MIISVFEREENIVGKGEIALQVISPFPTMFLQRLLSKLCQKVPWCGNQTRLIKFHTSPGIIIKSILTKFYEQQTINAVPTKFMKH